jgi:anti-sigma B factor antagonist
VKQEIFMDQVHPKISVDYVKKATIATLTDEKILEEADIQALEDSIMPLIESSEDIKLVLDFSNVEFLTSSVLGLLIRISKKVYESNGLLMLCGINSKILEIFKITRLDKVFDIHEDRFEAVGSM